MLDIQDFHGNDSPTEEFDEVELYVAPDGTVGTGTITLDGEVSEFVAIQFITGAIIASSGDLSELNEQTVRPQDVYGDRMGGASRHIADTSNFFTFLNLVKDLNTVIVSNDMEGTFYSDSGLVKVIGYKKRYATKNLSKTVVLTPENTTGGTFVNGTDVQTNSRYVIDIASVLGSDYVGKDLLLKVEIFNTTGTGVADWFKVPFASVYTESNATFSNWGVEVTKAGEELHVCTAGYGAGATTADTLLWGYAQNTLGVTSNLDTAPCRVTVWTVQQYIVNISTERPYIALSSTDTVSLGSDADNPSYLTGAVLESASDISLVDAATGAIQNDSGKDIPFMDGSISFNPDSLGGATVVMHIVSEISADGITWEGNLKSKRTVEVANSNESFATKVSLLKNFPNGWQARFRCWVGSGNLDLAATSETALGGQVFTTPSWLWIIGAE